MHSRTLITGRFSFPFFLKLSGSVAQLFIIISRARSIEGLAERVNVRLIFSQAPRIVFFLENNKRSVSTDGCLENASGKIVRSLFLLVQKQLIKKVSSFLFRSRFSHYIGNSYNISNVEYRHHLINMISEIVLTRSHWLLIVCKQLGSEQIYPVRCTRL